MKKFLPCLSLQTKLTICILTINIILLFFSISDILDTIAVNKRAENIAKITQCCEPFFLALEALAFERGRTNVVLSDANPIDDANRAFIRERRNQVDQNLTVGIENISKFFPLHTNRLQNNYIELQNLRAKADTQAMLPLAERELNLNDEWFASATKLINIIQETLNILGKEDQNPDLFNFYHQFQLNCLEFRLFSGQSASILTAAISQNTTFSAQKYQDFIETRAKADYIWSNIENSAAEFNTPEILQTKDHVFHEYYNIYRPLQNEILHDFLEVNFSTESTQALARTSVPAFDSIFALINTISSEKRNYVTQMNNKAMLGIRKALLEFILVIIFITVTLSYFRLTLFAPLKRIINALENIIKDQTAAYLPAEATRQDEIGLLAHFVQLLQLSMQEERRLKELNKTLAVTDKLTCLYNRQMLEQTLPQLTAHADRYGTTISMILFDLDRFKTVNDTWGHPIGDEVIKQTAQIAKKLIRTCDLLFRFGGEEFLILIPETGEAGAITVAEKVRIALETARHPVAGQVTVSLGVAVRKKEESFDTWYKRADKALYQAKNCGRNRVAFSRTETMPVASVHMVWRTEWASGNSQIDAQHQEILNKADAFFNISLLPDIDLRETQTLLENLLEDITIHFNCEELILVQLCYPDIEQHKQLHSQLLARIATLKEDYLNNTSHASSFIAFIIDDVVLGHMLKDDTLFFPYTKQKLEN